MVKIPTSGWAKTGGELKQIWPELTVEISNQSELEAFRDRVNAGETSLNATVIADITLTGEWTPIGSYDSWNFYTGTFDGGEHTITGLTMNSSVSYQGLFGYIGSSGTVKDLKLASVSFSGGRYVGAVAGYNNGTIENCHVTSGAVAATGPIPRAGGIIGYNVGTVTDCTNKSTVTATADDSCGGGIVGYSYGGTVTGCENSGGVSGTEYAGGIVAYNSNSSTVTGCTNSGTVSSTSYAGGIVGYNSSSTVSGNTNSGNISCSMYAGGIIGRNNGTASDNTNTGTVTGDTSYGV